MSMDPREINEMFNPEDEAKKIVDPIIQAFEMIAKATVESDRSLFELVQLLGKRVERLEEQMTSLMLLLSKATKQ